MAKAGWLLLAACLNNALLAHSYQYIGCYIDQDDRDLPEVVDKGGVHVSKCNSLCSSRGFLFFGLQDSSECFCGNNYGRYGVAHPGECDKRCHGNNGEFCGSRWRNSLYASDFANTGARSIGCFVDSVNRDLPALGLRDGSNSVQRCRDVCYSRKFLYFGLQVEQECWCGNDYGAHGETSLKDCQKRCPGQRGNFCGGDGRNNIYATGVRLLRLYGGSHVMSRQIKAELAAQVRSQQVSFPGGVLCDRCLIAAWGRREAELRGIKFNVKDLEGVIASYSDRIKEKLRVLKFGTNAKTAFEDVAQNLAGNFAVRSSFVGVAKRSGNLVEMGVVHGEVIAFLVPRHKVFSRQSCSQVWFWTKCNTETIREKIGYQVDEISQIDRALRSESFRLFSERAG